MVLPPPPKYDGGPFSFGADSPDGSDEEGWWFLAGDQRTAVPFAFWIGPDDAFGIHGPEWAPLHATIEGWVESVALARHAALWARSITKLYGVDVDGLDLTDFEPVSKVRGLSDTWWRAPGSYVAIFRGEAIAVSHPGSVAAIVYSGLPDHP